MTDLRDRVVVVTGGASGIGHAAVLLLAERGARVGVLDVDEVGAVAAAEEAMQRGAPVAVGITCDVSVETAVEKAFASLEERLGPVYGLFANAGIDIGGLVHELPTTVWERVLATNLTGAFFTCKYALRSMLADGRGGSIVCTSSPAASVALAAGGTAAYSASKAGISALVRCLAIDYARHGVRVNAIAPGATETRLMWANVPDAEVPQVREVITSEVPLGRLAEPLEPARAAVWLLSDDASYVTGSQLVCDGGILAKASISV